MNKYKLLYLQAGLRKGRGTRDQTANIHWIIIKTREFQKNIYCFIDYTKSFVWITTNCGNYLKRWEYQTTISASWETCVQVKKQQLELTGHGTMDWFQIRGKEYIKAVYCHSAYLTYMPRDWSLAPAGHEGPHLVIMGESRGFSRAVAGCIGFLLSYNG